MQIGSSEFERILWTVLPALWMNALAYFFLSKQLGSPSTEAKIWKLAKENTAIRITLILILSLFTMWALYEFADPAILTTREHKTAILLITLIPTLIISTLMQRKR